MKEKRKYFQPAYVKKFKCDGSKCDARCCKYWIIDIDKASYEDYEKIESAEKEITSKIKYFDKRKSYVALMNKDYACCCLTEDNLCMIQKNYGERYLSITCQTYPRSICKLGDIYERSLSVTCPVVAELALLPKDVMEFEVVEEYVPSKSKVQTKLLVNRTEIIPHIFDVQSTSISILQERALTLDQRLAVLGFFLDRVDEITATPRVYEVAQLAELYAKEGFIAENFSAILADIQFNPRDFVKILIGGVLQTLYGEENVPRKVFEVVIFDAVQNTLELTPDEDGTVSVNDTAEKYMSLNPQREEFIQRYGTILENYLVNEFFMNFYPWRLQ
ncbi:MAG: flagellin lysine-N-methylase, partial [Selenomonadaceae bacterium]|nr:flagellin lysine-N-methylase [Selenomonadaceae bacterium]